MTDELQEIDYAGAYAAARTRIRAIVEQADEEQTLAIAPATPDWRVRDILAHLAGIPDDILNGRVDGIASDEWTEAQVAPRRDMPLDEMLAAWESDAVQVEPLVGSFGIMSGQFITDLLTHEHDIRDALGVPGARESEGVAIAFDWLGARVGEARVRSGAGALRLLTEAGETTFGDGEPTATARTTRFELLRAATGRRAMSQIETWDWDGDARPETVVLGIFTPRAAPFDG